MSKRNYFLLSAQCAAQCAALCAVLSACPFEGNPSITTAKYVNENTFIGYYQGKLGEWRSMSSFTVKGKDTWYNMRSCAVSVALLDEKKFTCKIYGRFISGDHITVTSSEPPGVAEFDAPDYKD